MRAQEFIKLAEAPLPDDWDKNVFTPQNSYKKRIEYAVARAQKLGKGSSRTAFEIEHEGRPTVLKVAHNVKGMAQNEVEVNILTDGYAQHLDILIPIIDYDIYHDQPVWVHTEKAQRATNKQLCDKMQCGDLFYLVNTAEFRYTGRGRDDTPAVMEYYKLTDRNQLETFFEYVDQMQELMSLGVGIQDFTSHHNWGIYQGRPVVIDVGFNDDIYHKYYK